MKRLTSLVLAAFVAVVASVYLIPTASVDAKGSAALSIIPKKNYTIQPGKSVEDTLVIRNLDDKAPLHLTLRVVDFTYTGDGGTPKLMLGEDARQTTWSLKPFISIPESVTIDPKSSKTIDMKVAIPEGQGAGSYYSAIVYSTGSSPKDGGGNVGISASGVTLAFTSVPGQVKEDLKLEKFGVYDLDPQGETSEYKLVSMNAPKYIAYTLKNSGNVAESPVGSITYKYMFGEEKKITDVNPNGSLALIGQTRTFTSCIELKIKEIKLGNNKSEEEICKKPFLWPGYYSLKLDLYYGQNGNNTREIVGESSFWYLPLWFVIPFLIIIGLVVYGIWRIVQSIRTKLYGPQHKTKNKSRRK